MIEQFEKISISGRYIYAYLNLFKIILDRNYDVIPSELDTLLREFTSTNRLDDWHEKAEEILPSVILTNNFSDAYYDVINENTYDILRKYYLNQPKFILDLIENIVSLGCCNVYSAFESNFTLEPLQNIIRVLEKENINLINFDIIKDCSVEQKNGWGDFADIGFFIKQLENTYR